MRGAGSVDTSTRDVFIAYVDRAPNLFTAGIYAWDNDFM